MRPVPEMNTQMNRRSISLLTQFNLGNGKGPQHYAGSFKFPPINLGTTTETVSRTTPLALTGKSTDGQMTKNAIRKIREQHNLIYKIM